MCFDTESSSTSWAPTTSSTENKDMRIAGGNYSTLVSADNSNVTVTDAGVINAAFGFAKGALDGVLKSENQIHEAANDQVTKALASVETAWADAKAGEQKVLVGMGLIVVGIVAVQSFKKG